MKKIAQLLKKGLIKANQFKKIFTHVNPMHTGISRISFALDGLSLKDKINAFYLVISFENPYEERPLLIKTKIKTSGSFIELRHKRFNYLKLEYNLSDNYQMAICKEFFLGEAYDFSKIKFVPEQIIDCGAYKGYFSILASHKFPLVNIISIEPHPLNFPSLMKSIKVNSIQNINALNKAISTNKEQIQLFTEGTNGSISNIGGFTETFCIETIDLNNLIEQEKALLLKVDVEGAELEFFPDIINKLPKKCFIFLETHDGWNSLQNIKDKFIENGFQFQVCSEKGIYIDSLAQRV